MNQQLISRLIDHTLLRPEAKSKDIIDLCVEAREFGFAAVCVHPVFVSLARKELGGSQVKVATVIGFPLGAHTSLIKGLEAEKAVTDGAAEIDMVINIGYLKEGRLADLAVDIETVVNAVPGKLVKVILETCLLTDEEKTAGARIAVEAGAQFVKTSTGFSSGGATVEDVALLRKAVGSGIGVKASGGVRTYRAALALVEAGANRIGTSAGVTIVKEAADAQ